MDPAYERQLNRQAAQAQIEATNRTEARLAAVEAKLDRLLVACEGKAGKGTQARTAAS